MAACLGAGWLLVLPTMLSGQPIAADAPPKPAAPVVKNAPRSAPPRPAPPAAELAELAAASGAAARTLLARPRAPMPVHVASVSFDVGAAGEIYPVLQDTGEQRAFAPPHWRRARTFPSTTKQVEQSSPVCYLQGSWMKLHVRFVCGEALAPQQRVQVEGLAGAGTGAMRFRSASATEPTAEGFAVTVAADRPLPQHAVLLDPLTVRWRVRLDESDPWQEAGSTNNTLYVTLVAPPVRFQSVLHHSCRAAAGLTLEDADLIVQRIWRDFARRDVRRASDGRQLTYWAGTSQEQFLTKTSELLRYGDGRCGAWAHYFQDMLRAQGIAASRWHVTPDPDHPAPAGLDVGPTKLKHCGFRIAALPGQGTHAAVRNFLDHTLVQYRDSIYDPSYGVAFAPAGGADAFSRWREAMIELIVYVYEYRKDQEPAYLRVSHGKSGLALARLQPARGEPAAIR